MIEESWKKGAVHLKHVSSVGKCNIKLEKAAGQPDGHGQAPPPMGRFCTSAGLGSEDTSKMLKVMTKRTLQLQGLGENTG